MKYLFILFCVGVGLLILGFWARAEAHDIYGQVHGGNGQLCCGGDSEPGKEDGDCAPAQAKAVHGGVEFLVRGKEVGICSGRKNNFFTDSGRR